MNYSRSQYADLDQIALSVLVVLASIDMVLVLVSTPHRGFSFRLLTHRPFFHTGIILCA